MDRHSTRNLLTTSQGERMNGENTNLGETDSQQTVAAKKAWSIEWQETARKTDSEVKAAVNSIYGAILDDHPELVEYLSTLKHINKRISDTKRERSKKEAAIYKSLLLRGIDPAKVEIPAEDQKKLDAIAKEYSERLEELTSSRMKVRGAIGEIIPWNRISPSLKKLTFEFSYSKS